MVKAVKFRLAAEKKEIRESSALEKFTEFYNSHEGLGITVSPESLGKMIDAFPPVSLQRMVGNTLKLMNSAEGDDKKALQLAVSALKEAIEEKTIPEKEVSGKPLKQASEEDEEVAELIKHVKPTVIGREGVRRRKPAALREPVTEDDREEIKVTQGTRMTKIKISNDKTEDLRKNLKKNNTLVVQNYGPSNVVVGAPHHTKYGVDRMQCNRPGDENTGLLAGNVADHLKGTAVIACDAAYDPNKQDGDYMDEAVYGPGEVLIEIHGKGPDTPGDLLISCGDGSPKWNKHSKKFAEAVKKYIDVIAEEVAGNNLVLSGILKSLVVEGDFEKVPANYRATGTTSLASARSRNMLPLHIECSPQVRKLPSDNSQKEDQLPQVGVYVARAIACAVKELYPENAEKTSGRVKTLVEKEKARMPRVLGKTRYAVHGVERIPGIGEYEPYELELEEVKPGTRPTSNNEFTVGYMESTYWIYGKTSEEAIMFCDAGFFHEPSSRLSIHLLDSDGDETHFEDPTDPWIPKNKRKMVEDAMRFLVSLTPKQIQMIHDSYDKKKWLKFKRP